MTPQTTTSIQSYFPPARATPSRSTARLSTPPQQSSTSPQPREAGDGFTEEERRAAATRPGTGQAWIPPREYEEMDIADILPGPGCRTFTGRVANFFVQASASKMPCAARGCVKMIVKDDTGAISIRLWYARGPPTLRLGQLVSVWTPHVSDGEHGALAPRAAPLFASVFPERDRACHFMVHEHSDTGALCRAPLGYKIGRALAGLMALRNFVEGGHDAVGARVLVLVKWVGAKKVVATRRGVEEEVVRVGLFDDTAEATLTLWGPVCLSVGGWRVSQTVLLLANPGVRCDRTACIALNANTVADVDPDIEDAEWLRGYARRLTRRKHVNPEFPRDVFDFDGLMQAQLRIKYTLADLDEFARAAPSDRFVGFMSVVIAEMNLSLLQRRNMIMCTECCGVPIFTNKMSARCKQCGEDISLRVNPRVLGALVDETGSTTCGKVIVSEQAWEHLLGRPAAELVKMPTEALRAVEQRLLFLRVTLVFGWAAEEDLDAKAGRLCIWDFYS